MWGLVVGALAGGALAQNQNEDLERLARELAQPGPEAQDVRFSAAQELLGRTNPAAHAVLHARLVVDTDPDGVRRMILERLEGRLRDGRDKVFGDAEGRDPAVRLALHASYVRPLAHIMSLGEGPLDSLARSCYLRLETQARFDGIAALLATPDAVPLGLVAARDSRLPRAGGLLAALLADPVHGEAARAALGQLTFHPGSFADASSFEAWYEANQGLTYTDLAERAARGLHTDLTALRRSASQKLVQARARLAVALCSAQEIAWDEVAALCAPEVDPEQVRACLVAIAPRLAERLHEGNGVRERRALHQSLVARLDAPVASEALRGLLLEVSAYLLRPADPAEEALRTAVVDRLRGAIANGRPEVRLAALRGIRRFYSPENWRAVLAALEGELDVVYREHGGGESLPAASRTLIATALGTLSTSTPRWFVPSSGTPEMLQLGNALDKVMGLPEAADLQRDAISLARQADRDGKRADAMYRFLERVAKSGSRSPELRRLAFVYAQDFFGGEALFEDYIGMALELLVDPATELRRLAVERLMELSDADDRIRKCAPTIFLETRDRLTEETDASVYKQLVKLFMACAMPPLGDASGMENVVTALENAINEVHREPVRPEIQFREEPLLSELNVLAASPVAPVEVWIKAVSVLIERGQRRRARDVLERVRPVEAGHAEAVTAWTLPLRVALMRTPDEPLLADEAAAVSKAMDQLRTTSVKWETLETRILQVEVANALGENARAVSIAKSLLESTEKLGDRAAVAMGEAFARNGNPTRAVDLLAAVAPAGPYAAVAAGQLEQIVRAQRQANVGACLRAAKAMRALLTDQSPEFRERLLLWAEVHQQHAPDEQKEVRSALDTWRATFTAPDCPEPLRQRYEVLQSKIAVPAGAGG